MICKSIKGLFCIFSKEGLNDEKDPVARQELQALSSSIKNLLAQWFAVGLLDLRRVTWDSPGSILEKVLTEDFLLLLGINRFYLSGLLQQSTICYNYLIDSCQFSLINRQRTCQYLVPKERAGKSNMHNDQEK